MNEVVLVGRITRDVTVKRFNVNRVMQNTLAVKRHQKNSKGDAITDFIPFVAWNQSADLIEKYVKKGEMIALSGRMTSRHYQKDDGTKVYVIELLVEEVTLLPQRERVGGGIEADPETVSSMHKVQGERTMYEQAHEAAPPIDEQGVVPSSERLRDSHLSLDEAQILDAIESPS